MACGSSFSQPDRIAKEGPKGGRTSTIDGLDKVFMYTHVALSQPGRGVGCVVSALASPMRLTRLPTLDVKMFARRRGTSGPLELIADRHAQETAK